MKLQLTLTKREIEGLEAVVHTAGADAEAMISEGIRGSMKEGYLIEHGCETILALIRLAKGES